MIEQSTKICVKCHLKKSLDSFHKNKNKLDGLDYYCKDCRCASSNRWNRANIHRKINTGNHKASVKKWRSANSEKYKSDLKKWRLANSSKICNYSAKYRTLKKKAIPVWANTEFEKFAISEMYALAEMRTKATGIKHHVDHIVPINSKLVQGFHCLANLQILEARANIIKGNRTWPNMP